MRRVAPLVNGSILCVTSERGGRFACPVRGRSIFRLGFIRGTTKMGHVINSSRRMVNSFSLYLVASPSLRRM